MLVHSLTCRSHLNERCCRNTTHVPAAAVPVRPAEEIEGVRQACLVARKILDTAHAAVRPGVTTEEIDRIVRPLYPAKGFICGHDQFRAERARPHI